MPNNNMKDYLKFEGSLTNDNYELIEEAKYFEDLDVHGDSCCTSIQLSHFFFLLFSVANKYFVVVFLLLSLTFPSFWNRFLKRAWKEFMYKS